MEEIAYRPQNVRETLVELKNTSELAVDLGYAATLYNYPGLAEEVLELEARADSLQYPAKIALMLAAKRSSDAEQLVGIIQIVEAAVSITNAAANIAAIIVNDIGLPQEVRAALPAAAEMIMRATVSEDSDVVGNTLGTFAFETEAGVSVIAIRRGKEWNIAPDEDTVLKEGDVVIGSGSDGGVSTVKKMLTGIAEPPEEPPQTEVEELERASELVMDLKNIAELAVGLSYAATLFDDAELAAEVRKIESRSDVLKTDVETLVIESGGQISEPSRLRGLLHLATASEVICDAAGSIADIVLRDGRVHPVFGQAIGESDELITTTTIGPDSELGGATLEALELEEQTGMLVMAVHREEDWILAPTGETRLLPDDTLIARGPKDGAKQLRSMAMS